LSFVSLIQFTELQIRGTNLAHIAAKQLEQRSEGHLSRQKLKKGKVKNMATALLLNKFQRLIYKKKKWKNEVDQFVFGQKMGLMTKLFGCWHENISRPFVQGRTSYRSCLNCGARRQFNPETLQTYGKFYFPPVVKEIRN
jgi:hypothetical protein